MRNQLLKRYFDRYVELARDCKEINHVSDCLRIAHNIGRFKEDIFIEIVNESIKSPEFAIFSESDYDTFFSHLCKLYYRVEEKAMRL